MFGQQLIFVNDVVDPGMLKIEHEMSASLVVTCFDTLLQTSQLRSKCKRRTVPCTIATVRSDMGFYKTVECGMCSTWTHFPTWSTPL